MTRLLFLDTETTGTNPAKARLCELSVLLADCTDNGMERLSLFSSLVRPDEMDQFPSPASTRIHGIDGDTMLEAGLSLDTVLGQLNTYIAQTQDGGLPKVIGHNIKFDLSILAAEHIRSGVPYQLNKLQPFCTMLAMAKVRNTRWENLERCWRHAFGLGADYGEGHRARADVEHVYELYSWGLQRGVWHCD